MQYFILIAASLLFSLLLLLSLFKYNNFLLTRKRAAKWSIYEILDQILHNDPAISDQEWNKSLLDKYEKIKQNQPDALIPVLWDETSMPLRIAFFALYYNLKRRKESFSRAQINEFVKGVVGNSHQEIINILEYALSGFDLITKVDVVNGSNYFTNFDIEIEFLKSRGANLRSTLITNFSSS